MKRIGWLSIGIALLAIASASAAIKTSKNGTTQASCRSAEWPYARLQTKEELHKLFNMAKREVLVEYFFGEIVKPRDQRIAYPLSVYLINTEPNKNMRGFFKTVTWAAEVNDNMAKPKSVKLDELCQLYAKAKALK